MNPALLDAVLEQMAQQPEAARVVAADLLAMADGKPTQREYTSKEKWALGMLARQVPREQLEAALERMLAQSTAEGETDSFGTGGPALG